MAEKTGVDFLSHSGGAFAAYTDADDLLHPIENATVTDDTLSETQYFGFMVPDREINGFGYFWAHPNLGVVTGGVMEFQGMKPLTLSAELFDMRAYMSAKILRNDLREYRFGNGYQVTCIEPMMRHRMAYNDAFRKNSFEIELSSIMPPAMDSPRGHFEQAMSTKGLLTLSGKTFEVDFCSVRDRSWGKSRAEDITPLPPMRFTDSGKCEYSLAGKVVAACRWPAWPNLRFSMTMARWQCNGSTRYGDIQKARWADLVKRHLQFD